jgi:hypothetical protein
MGPASVVDVDVDVDADVDVCRCVYEMCMHNTCNVIVQCALARGSRVWG